MKNCISQMIYGSYLIASPLFTITDHSSNSHRTLPVSPYTVKICYKFRHIESFISPHCCYYHPTLHHCLSLHASRTHSFVKEKISFYGALAHRQYLRHLSACYCRRLFDEINTIEVISNTIIHLFLFPQ